MTIRRYYDCDLCGTTIYKNTDKNALIGLYWSGNKIELKPYKTVEHHICTNCLYQLRILNIADIAEVQKG